MSVKNKTNNSIIDDSSVDAGVVLEIGSGCESSQRTKLVTRKFNRLDTMM